MSPDSNDTGTRPGRDSQAQRENTRRKILATALAEFAAQGYFAASTRDIARRAGMAAGLMYRYFPTKEELLRELIDRSVAAWKDERQRRIGERPFADLREFLATELVFQRDFLLDDRSDTGRFFLRHLFQDQLPGRGKLIACLLPGETLAAQIAAAQERGELKPKVTAEAVRSLAEMVCAKFLHSFYFPDPDWPVADAAALRPRIENCLQAVFANVLKAPAVKKPPVSRETLQGNLF